MKSVGVKDMEIYLNGTQAVLIMAPGPTSCEIYRPECQKFPREKEGQN